MSESMAPGAAGSSGWTGSPAEQSTAPDYSGEPVAYRRPESLGGLLLILAGIAAAISLALDWLADDAATGWRLVRDGFEDLGGIADTGLWQPLAIVLGGGALLVLGLLMLIPARTHRFLGVLALLVALLVAAGVIVVANGENWAGSAFASGFWFALAVAVLGLLGALKAMLTGAKVT